MNRRILVSITMYSALAVFPALAQDTHKPQPLPGVDGTYSIVTPAPEPQQPPADAAGTKRFGSWELTVSGYVWVQVGASSARGD